MADLGTLGGLTSGATGVNDQGVVVGASLVSCPTCTPKQTPSHAFRFQSGQLTDLGTLGGKSSAAKAINNNGWIVGWAHTTGNASHAALWKPGSAAQDLGTMGGPTSIAWGTNKKNQIVGQERCAESREVPRVPLAERRLYRSGSAAGRRLERQRRRSMTAA